MKGNEDENPLRPFLFFNTESADTKLVLHVSMCMVVVTIRIFSFVYCMCMLFKMMSDN